MELACAEVVVQIYWLTVHRLPRSCVPPPIKYQPDFHSWHKFFSNLLLA